MTKNGIRIPPPRKGGDIYSEDPNVLALGATYEYFNFIDPFDGEITAKELDRNNLYSSGNLFVFFPLH
ncbi:hypothetical protein M1N79_03730 [Dehalococcoidia bacterium]|nr:hypothetical protein [Dehalococcoidia bacterium]